MQKKRPAILKICKYDLTAYQLVIFAIDHLNFSECTKTVYLNGL